MQLANSMQDMVDAEKAAKSGKKVKKKKKKKKKKKGGKKGKKGKKKKDPTADRALEHLYVEMVSNGILQQPFKVPCLPLCPAWCKRSARTTWPGSSLVP